MRYYKLLTKFGYSKDDSVIGKIYPETSRIDLIYVKDLSNYYPNDWQEVPAGDYFVQEGKMPEYFAIKRVADNHLWGKYINWLSKKYNHIFDGYAYCYGFGGSTTYFDMFRSSLDKFKNNPVELTLEQWDQIVNKNKMKEFKLPEKWCVLSQGEDTYKKYLQPYLKKRKYKNFEWNGKEYYYHFSPKETFSGGIVASGFTEITFEQFIEYILKEEVMNEIIGWKLKEDCKQYEQAALKIVNSDHFFNFSEGYNFSTNSRNETVFKQAGVLELWFEPVYSQKFKKGDWITVTGNIYRGWLADTKARTFQITHDKTNYFSGKYFGVSGDGYINAGLYADFRLATEEEVKSAQPLKFGGYDVAFEKVTSGVRISCNGETGALSQIEAIYNYFKPNSTYFKFGSQEVKRVEYSNGAAWNLEYENEAAKSIKIGCTTGTWEEFVAIYEKAKSML